MLNYICDENDIDLKHIDNKILKGFEEYLHMRNCKINTISNHLRTLRAIYNRAIKDKVVKEEYYPFKNYSIRYETTQKRAITKADLDKIRKLNLEGNEKLEKSLVLLH